MNALGYARCSSREQQESGLGILSQESQIRAECERRGFHLLEILADEGFSASSMDRPAMNKAIDLLSSGQADILVVSKIDRLTRSLLNAAQVLDQAKREGWALLPLDMPLDITTPSGEFMAGMLANVAQFERRLISQRTKDALAAARARGQILGRPRVLSDSLLTRMAEMRMLGLSYRQIADQFTSEGLQTAQGAPRWSGSTIYRSLNQTALKAS